MKSKTPTRKRGWIYGLFGLWILEWVFDWSAYLGPLESVIWVLWTLGLFYFVFESRSGRMPRWLHSWGWMGAVLLIAGLRAWVIGEAGFLLFSELIAQAFELHPEGVSIPALGPEFLVFDAFATSMVLGFIIGFAGVCEALFIAVASWLGDFFRERRVPARAALFPRVGVVVLQAPIFVGLLGVGLCAVAGAVGAWAHPEAVPGAAGGNVTEWIGPILALGLAAWALAVAHLGRLSALAAGGRATRVLLGLYGVVGFAALVGLTQSVLWGSCAIVWLWLQIVALRRAGSRTA